MILFVFLALNLTHLSCQNIKKRKTVFNALNKCLSKNQFQSKNPFGMYIWLLPLLVSNNTYCFQFFSGISSNITLRPPVPTHKARFMMRIIYAFKILLLAKDFGLTRQQRTKVESMCHFFLHLYAVPWFTANFAADAAFYDLQLFKRLESYRKWVALNFHKNDDAMS